MMNLSDVSCVRIRFDTASVISSDDAAVPVLTPGRAKPGICDPVFHIARLAPTDDVDLDVDCSGTASGRDDAAVIGIELHGVHASNDGAMFVDGLLHVVHALQKRRSCALELGLGLVELACSNSGSVGIVRIEHNTLLGKGEIVPGSWVGRAALGHTVDKHLGGENRELRGLVLLGIARCEGGHSTKDRRGDALGLVLDGRNNALRSGIIRGRKVRDGALKLDIARNLGKWTRSGHVGNLVREPVRKHGWTVTSGFVALGKEICTLDRLAEETVTHKLLRRG